MDEMMDTERYLITTLLADAHLADALPPPGDVAGWRYRSTAALLLDVGRLFTSAEVAAEVGAERGCWVNATHYAERHPDAVYVEGYAAHLGPHLTLGVAHAWCATGTTALDPTPGWADGAVYLGVPFADDYRRFAQLLYGVGPLLVGEMIRRPEWLQEGIPDGALADVGQPLPDLSALRAELPPVQGIPGRVQSGEYRRPSLRELHTGTYSQYVRPERADDDHIRHLVDAVFTSEQGEHQRVQRVLDQAPQYGQVGVDDWDRPLRADELAEVWGVPMEANSRKGWLCRADEIARAWGRPLFGPGGFRPDITVDTKHAKTIP